MLSERMVEIPITLPMDHTLINVLRKDVVTACRAKAKWVDGHHGVACSLFHPDYNTDEEARSRYAAVVRGLAENPAAWGPLPEVLSDWWQRRRHSRVVARDGGYEVEGPAAEDAAVWWAHRDGERLRIVPGDSHQTGRAAAAKA
jgi:hypothetical protein